MSATQIAVTKAVDIAILVMLGDKVAAEQERQIRRVLTDAMEGKMTDQEAYNALRFKDGDALDQMLKGTPPPSDPPA